MKLSKSIQLGYDAGCMSCREVIDYAYDTNTGQHEVVYWRCDRNVVIQSPLGGEVINFLVDFQTFPEVKDLIKWLSK